MVAVISPGRLDRPCNQLPRRTVCGPEIALLAAAAIVGTGSLCRKRNSPGKCGARRPWQSSDSDYLASDDHRSWRANRSRAGRDDDTACASRYATPESDKARFGLTRTTTLPRIQRGSTYRRSAAAASRGPAHDRVTHS
jgi:hypothetical protein